MAFKALFIAHAPDADMRKHRSVITTSLYQLFTVVVRNQEEAESVAKKFLREKEIHSILLCPGFTHTDVARIQKVVKGKAGVSVARGDGPSSRIAQTVMEKVGWFKKTI